MILNGLLGVGSYAPKIQKKFICVKELSVHFDLF